MKIIYSELKKLLPALTSDYQKLRDDITLIGHFASGFEEIDGEQIYDLEVRQNRGDCQGYYGIAKDLSVFYNIPLVLPENSIKTDSSKILPIKINSADVKRVLALSINNLQVKDSPNWLRNFLALHDINSINNIVDATNYIMMVYGIPCHAFDVSKTGSNLIWENNQNKFKQFITLDGTPLELSPETLLISNDKEPLSLSFIGGQNSGIGQNTHSTILEMAVYNRSRVRKDSRGLKTITEASIRLDKDLDTELISIAFNHLVQLVLDLAGGQIDSQIFENYSQKPELSLIEFNSQQPSQFAGIDIPADYAIDCLTRLDCKVEKKTDFDYLITPPTIRKDINLTEDLVEEVIRFWGYNKIPLNEPINPQNPGDITPPVLYLIDSYIDKLVSLGYDEVRSWPLVQSPVDQSTAIFTQNSINSEYPVLRQSIVQSLHNQYSQYDRYKLTNQKFFEVGKIFSKIGDKYTEKYSLGISNPSATKLMNDIKELIKTDTPQKYLVDNIINQHFAEIILEDLEKPISYVPSSQSNSAVELTSQIITLDANITLDHHEDEIELIKKYSQKINKKILWQMIITDYYFDQKNSTHKYTFRVSFYNIDDKTAKKIHLETFDLI